MCPERGGGYLRVARAPVVSLRVTGSAAVRVRAFSFPIIVFRWQSGRETTGSSGMREIIFEVTEAPEGGYDARALGHSVFTQGDDWDDLKEMVRDPEGAQGDPIALREGRSHCRMRLPRDLSGRDLARRLERHYGHRVTRMKGSHNDGHADHRCRSTQRDRTRPSRATPGDTGRNCVRHGRPSRRPQEHRAGGALRVTQ